MELLNRLFVGLPVIRKDGGAPNVIFPITDFHPASRPSDVEELSVLLFNCFDRWSEVDALVGVADRSSGPLTHMLAILAGNKPYSLANWYPAGSIGDIHVEAPQSFSGAAGHGNMFVNGLKRGMKVVFVDDVIRSGNSRIPLLAALQKNGVKVLGSLFLCSLLGRGGLNEVSKLKIPAISLCVVDLSGKTSKMHHVSPDALKKNRVIKFPRVPSTAEIKKMPLSTMKAKFQRTLDSFVGISIYKAKDSEYPYCNFALTDFVPLLDPCLVEDMADCMIYLSSTNLTKCDVIVSESDRGGGPLCVALSRRTGLPYTMANWSQSVDDVGGVNSRANVGYSGQGHLFLNGVSKGFRCCIVDDMLSSGGTCEALIKAIEAAGAKVLECHFASEKITTGGRLRLQKQWPSVNLISLCYFVASGSKTEAKNPPLPANATPLQPNETEEKQRLSKSTKQQKAVSAKRAVRQQGPKKTKRNAATTKARKQIRRKPAKK